MKIIKIKREGNKKYAIKFNEQYDWFDDETSQEMRDYQSNEADDFEIVNWEANEEELPVFKIDEYDEDAGGYLVDDFVKEEEVPERFVEQEPTLQKRDNFEEKKEEIDEVDESVAKKVESDERSPDFATVEDALKAAIEENRVIEIFYVTKGRGNKKRYLKREVGLPRTEGGGVHIHRIIEPHYIYIAKNGNSIVVTYDRSVRHIRAFIIDNIYDYNFTKSRKTKKDQYFKPRMRVIPNSGKGIMSMENINDKLNKIAFTLKDKGMSKSSLIVQEAVKAAVNYKKAQYVGIQGYWLKNRRCWDNCYRHKRTSKPEMAAQEVWMECWDEYKDSINKNDSGWEKYASDDSLNIDKKAEQEWNKIFAEKIDKKVKEGLSRPESIYIVIEDESQKYSTKIIESASDLMTLADTFTQNGHEEIGKQMAEVSVEMLKEAQFSGGWSGALNKMRKYNPFSSKSREKGRVGDIITRLKNISQQSLQLANQFNTIVQQSRQYGVDEQAYQQQQQEQQQKREQTMQNVKSAPGKAFNWLKDKGKQVIPSIQQGVSSLSKSDVGIKIAAPVDPSFAQGANDYTIQLRDEFQTFLGNIRNEASSMSQIAAQTQDLESKQRASQASQRMMEFIQKATPFEQAFNQRSEMVNQSDELVGYMQSFANDINNIQMGMFNADNQQDVDKDGVVDSVDVDDNNNGVDDRMEDLAPVEGDLSNFANQLLGSQDATHKQMINRILNKTMTQIDLEFILNNFKGSLNKPNWEQFKSLLENSNR